MYVCACVCACVYVWVGYHGCIYVQKQNIILSFSHYDPTRDQQGGLGVEHTVTIHTIT